MSAEQGAASRTAHRYFTLEGYRDILGEARARDYRVVPFRAFDGPDARPVLLLRHDLDHSIRGVEQVAEIEASLGMSATWFVQTACEFYNLLAPSGRALLARITALGHEIGLHYESRRYAGTDGERRLRDDIRLLEDLGGQAVVSAAQHLPSDQDPVDVLGVVRNEAYEPRFTEAPMHYVSDSLMAWRQATPHDLIARGVSFQFLTHPETWLGAGDDIFDTLARMGEGEAEAVRQRYAALSGYYRELLDGRSERDRAFRRKRGRD